MDTKRKELTNLQTGRQSKGKKPRTTVWGKLLVCSCGHAFNRRVWDRKNGIANAGYQCYGSVRSGSYESRKKRGLPLEGICQTPMIPEWRLQLMANLIFRSYLNNKDKVLALANSMLEAHIGDTEEKETDASLVEHKKAELEKLNRKLDNFIEMRSEGEIGKDIFRAKCSEIEPKIERLQKEIEELSVTESEMEIVDYREKITVLQYAIEQYTDFKEGEDIPECVIEAFVEKIVASKDGFDWYLRFDGDPNDPLKCTVSGKRKTTAKIAVAGVNSPSIYTGDTGRDPQ